MPTDGLDEIQRRLAYRFRQPRLLLEALTHRSYLNEARGSGEADNERLEFLGDAVLGLVVSEYLLHAFPGAAEGALSKLRARLVSEKTLARVANGIGLGEPLRLGRGETKTEGRSKPSILADALEAVIAGVYLDGGLGAATACVKAAFRDELASCDRSLAKGDPKTDLQELCQRDFGMLPQYRTVRATGPDHEKLFEVEILIRGDRYGVGTGKSKKDAEQAAARQALAQLRKDGGEPCGTGSESSH
ncbi:MAG: ribonuclease III [Nitrospirae bacterium]|nr:MAG: ribonuclease III [Nitrospirota bacterium]